MKDALLMAQDAIGIMLDDILNLLIWKTLKLKLTILRQPFILIRKSIVAIILRRFAKM